MLSTKTMSIATLLLLSLTACQSITQAPTTKQDISPVLQLTSQQLFDAKQPLLNANNFSQVVRYLSNADDITSVNQALYYLRAYSYFGPVKEISETQKQQLSDALASLANNKLMASNPRFQEQFAVTLYRYFNDDKQAQQVKQLLPFLRAQLESQTASVSNQANDFALWESLRAYGFMLHKAGKKPDGDLAKVLINARVDKSIIAFANSNKSIIKMDDWPLQNAYWALALYRLALPSGDDGKPTMAEQATDNAATAIADADIGDRGELAKMAYTFGYHVNTQAGRELCEKDTERCVIPKQEIALPHRHDCSKTTFITHQDLTAAELAESCTKLTSQESGFHQLLATQNKPTANDHNHALEVVVFKNWSQYNAYGQLIYDIRTNNGGMYLEGTPQKQGNQARFFAFRQWWVEPKFAVWNLNHEYVHYLDGRFTKYGKFGHFPSHMVWWSEGLAEYVSKGNDNERSFKLARENKASAPSLKTIFATEYKDGLDRTYRWSYLAIRYLAEKHPEQLVQLSNFLKDDYFGGYKSLLTEIEAHQTDYEAWLEALLKANPKPDDKAKDRLHKIDRYSYRDYLKPDYLALDEQHKHY
ncbi:collagenase [Shewanella sp. OPT22]|nr:collagenase [Shewanella sp. OPT22]